MKTDEIKIEIHGSKQFRQMVIDKIYELLMDEEFFSEAEKPGNGYTLTSSIEPSDEVM